MATNKTESEKILNRMETFTEKNLPSLSETVLGALELFSKNGLPNVKFPNYKRPLIVGSGNANVTARILYADSDAVFADENDYIEKSKLKIDGAIVFSASGKKHAPIIIDYLLKKGIKTTLVTCFENSPGAKLLNKKNVIVTDKNREPYTYNTSTYLGWILAKTRENPVTILNFIRSKIDKIIPKNIGKYSGYLLINPNEFSGVSKLFDTKFVELFGRRLGKDVRTYEEMKHAITVVPYDKELCIQFGKKEPIIYEGDTIHIPLNPKSNLGSLMAIGYYVIGKIQENKPQYFKKNIVSYCKKSASKSFGKGISPIAE